MRNKLPCTQELKRLLKYTLDGKLVWNRTGKRAGSQRTDGYRTISIGGSRFLEHRVIWVLAGNLLPDGLQIDHIDRNPRNNRIENLRAVTVSKNQLNCNPQKNNTSSFTGVSWHKANSKWRAFVRLKGKQHHIGYFSSAVEAFEARMWWLRKQNK